MCLAEIVCICDTTERSHQSTSKDKSYFCKSSQTQSERTSRMLKHHMHTENTRLMISNRKSNAALKKKHRPRAAQLGADILIIVLPH